MIKQEFQEEIKIENVKFNELKSFLEKLKTFQEKQTPQVRFILNRLSENISKNIQEVNLPLESRNNFKLLKEFFKKEVLNNPNSIELVDFTKDFNKIYKDIFSKEIDEEKQLSIITALIPFEEKKKEKEKEEIKLDLKEKNELADMFASSSKTYKSKYFSNFDENEKITISLVEGETEKPYIKFSGKIFSDDFNLIRSLLKNLEDYI